MKGITLLLLAAAVLAFPARAHDKAAAAECAEIKAKIRAIESRMRAGYTAAQGRKLEERLRKLKAKRFKVCR